MNSLSIAQVEKIYVKCGRSVPEDTLLTAKDDAFRKYNVGNYEVACRLLRTPLDKDFLEDCYQRYKKEFDFSSMEYTATLLGRKCVRKKDLLEAARWAFSEGNTLAAELLTKKAFIG